MNATRDPEAVLSAWLDEGPTDLPDATRRAILTSLPTTPQARRGPLAPWRFDPMNTFARAATLAAVAAIALAGGLYLIGQQPGTGTRTPAPSPSSATTAAANSPSSPTSTTDTAAWIPFSSGRHGYDARYPSGSTVRPATDPLTFEFLASQDGEPFLGGDMRFVAVFDDMYDTFSPAGFVYPIIGAVSTRLPEGMSEDDWLTAYGRADDRLGERTCIPPRGDWQSINVDGLTGGLYLGGCGFHEVLVFAGGRAYTFTVTNGMGGPGSGNDVELLLAFVSTVTLHPDRADDST